MPSPYSSAARAIYSVDDSFWRQDPWLIFNQQLSRDAAGLPNEAYLDRALEMAQDLDTVDPAVFWLTLARIAELAIKLAGDYADGCEFQAAGDLLVNPRRIDVHQRGESAIVQKDRHRALSEQFAQIIGTRHPVAWLKRETRLEIKSEAVLPYLKGLMRSSGYLTPAYLEDVEQRLCRLADTISFLCAGKVADSHALYRQIQSASPLDRQLIVGHLCRFDNRYFVEMGEDIEAMILNGEHRSRFLKRVPEVCMA